MYASIRYFVALLLNLALLLTLFMCSGGIGSPWYCFTVVGFCCSGGKILRQGKSTAPTAPLKRYPDCLTQDGLSLSPWLGRGPQRNAVSNGLAPRIVPYLSLNYSQPEVNSDTALSHKPPVQVPLPGCLSQLLSVFVVGVIETGRGSSALYHTCLLYTSDAADE